MKRLWLIVLAAGLLVGCGDDSEPTAEDDRLTGLAAVEQSMGDITSGRIDLRIVTLPDGADPVVFTVAGAFSVASGEDEIPVTDLTYTQSYGASVQESRFVADGERAWVVTSERTFEVEADKIESLKGGDDVAGLEGLHPTKWFQGEVTEAPGEPVDGDQTTAYSGEVDAVAVLADTLGLVGNLGAHVPSSLEGPAAEQVRGAVDSVELALLAGTDDDIIRSVVYKVTLRPDVDVSDALGELAGTTIELNVELTDVNEPVEAPSEPESPADETNATTTSAVA